jgi:hypothetical protein
MEEKLFDLIGLGVPFYLAAATYAVFIWLDNNASDDVTEVISSWLHGRSQRKPDFGNVIVNAFDWIYTSPLMQIKALRRSAAVSTTIWLLSYFIPWSVEFNFLPKESVFWNVAHDSSFISLAIGVMITLPFVILSDYISLFVVRGFLVLASAHPIKASIGAFTVGYFIITSLFSVLVSAMFYVVLALKLAVVTGDPAESLVRAIYVVLFILFGNYFLGILAPALIIHLWLPLFALSSLVIKVVYWMFRAVESAQWFLKQGDAHPFKAIGIVATIIVFGSAMLVKEAWTVL